MMTCMMTAERDNTDASTCVCSLAPTPGRTLRVQIQTRVQPALCDSAALEQEVRSRMTANNLTN